MLEIESDNKFILKNEIQNNNKEYTDNGLGCKNNKNSHIYTAETSFATNNKNNYFYLNLENKLKNQNQEKEHEKEKELYKTILDYENLINDRYEQRKANIINEIENLIKEKKAKEYHIKFVSERKRQLEIEKEIEIIKLQIKHKYNEMNSELIKIKNNALKNINNRYNQNYN